MRIRVTLWPGVTCPCKLFTIWFVATKCFIRALHHLRMRLLQVWPLSDNASLKYVLQAVRMRNSPTVTLVLSSSPVVPDLAAAAALAEAAVSATGASSSASQRGAEAAPSGSPGAKEELGLLDALGQ